MFEPQFQLTPIRSRPLCCCTHTAHRVAHSLKFTAPKANKGGEFAHGRRKSTRDKMLFPIVGETAFGN